eukprot:s2849_g2.t1
MRAFRAGSPLWRDMFPQPDWIRGGTFVSSRLTKAWCPLPPAQNLKHAMVLSEQRLGIVQVIEPHSSRHFALGDAW